MERLKHMTKESKIGLKLEVCRDKNNKLTIVAHFNTDAPNIIISKNEYMWIPTPEEKDLINEAFELLPLTKTFASPIKKEPEKTPVVEKKEEPELAPEVTPTIEEDPPEELPPLEKNEEPAIFEVTKEEPNTEDIKTDIDKELEKNIDEISKEIEDKKSDSEDTDKTEEDEGVLVEADSDAIEAAIKKHREKDKDDSIIEADEKTIVDRVLNQKKKGKWRR